LPDEFAVEFSQVIMIWKANLEYSSQYIKKIM
jgi:hypothetical protein